MAIINDLPSMTSPASGDELPIERGTATYKIDYDVLAAAILDIIGGDPVTIPHGGTGVTTAPAGLRALGGAPGLNLTGTTWEALYTQLTAIPTNYTATFKCNADVTSVLTGSKVSAMVYGVVSRLTDSIFAFLARQDNSAYLYAWRVTFASGGASATVGDVYRNNGFTVI